MKKFLMILLLSASAVFAQNSLQNKDYYYGDGEDNSTSLQIAVGDSASPAYYISNSMVMIAVDSNWTASNIGFMIYNYLEAQWEPLTQDGAVLEYQVAPNAPVVLVPAETGVLKYIKFYKVTSGSDVDQAGSPTSIQITTIRL